MPVNRDLLDSSVSHQIGLQRLSSGVRDKVIAHLNRVEDDLIARIRERTDTASFTDRRLRQVLADVRSMLSEAQGETFNITRDELRGLASYEAEFQERMISDDVPIELSITQPSRQQLQAIVTSRPFQGKLLREWVEDLTDAQRRNIRDALRVGMTEGETVDQMVRRIRGTRAQRFRDGVMETTRRQSQAMVRTAVNHTASSARETLYRENNDLIRGVQWVSTLDTRTTAICMSRDGQVYPPDSGPRPPAHVNCRSTTTPVLRSWQELGINARDVPESTRASMDGQVPDKTTYPEWLRRQSVERQEEALGPAKARLFREGNLDIDRFVDDSGRAYSLDELRSRESAAFERAGLAA